MATFQVQVEGLTSLSIGTTPTTAELAEFLKDGVIDVTNRWLAVKPQDIELFARESSEQTSNASLHLNGAKIISIIREDGTNNQWRNCRKISPALQHDVTDVDSLNYASKINPAYMVGNNGQISVFPSPDSDPDSFKVYYVNNDPEDKGGTNLIHSHSDIGYFPDDKVYLVVLYASMRSLQAKMGATTISDLSITAVPPDVPSLSASSVSFSQAAPTYAKVGFNSDPGAFSLNAVPPDAPTLSSTSVSITGTAPTYDTTVATSALTEANNFIDSDEDVELANAKLAEVQALMQDELNEFNQENIEYQAILQKDFKDAEFDNQEDARLLQKYQGDLAVYQADVGAEVQEYTQNLQRGLQQYQSDIQQELNEFNEENAEYQAQLQISIKNADFDNQEDARKVQKYQAEQAQYAAEVNSEVQEYTQNLQADGVGYQWLQGQYAALKTEYDAAFAMAAPKPPPQQQARR